MPLISPHRTNFVALAAMLLAASATHAEPLTYRLTASTQDRCYDNSQARPCAAAGAAFHGQDAQAPGARHRYSLSQDGLSVRDAVSGLVWQQSPDSNGDGRIDAADKLTWAQARQRPAALNAMRFGGHDDWRLPSIKELYSLISFNGSDPAGGRQDPSRLTPFIDTRFFAFAYGQPTQGERLIDAQYASSTAYSAVNRWGGTKLFGVNFADGRIKGYDLVMPDGREKRFFVLCVRGNPDYGRNRFRALGDGTVSDLATGLMWLQADSGRGMDWATALAWVQGLNRQAHLGHRDWRLPTATELHSLVDYSRAPDSTGTAAIDPLFSVSSIRNEAGQADYPYYWTSSTHASADAGPAAVYIAFGRALGYMRGQWQDVHGAGAQRSDPKSGDPAQFPYGRGPQGDAIRIHNHVRAVRDSTSIKPTES